MCKTPFHLYLENAGTIIMETIQLHCRSLGQGHHAGDVQGCSAHTTLESLEHERCPCTGLGHWWAAQHQRMWGSDGWERKIFGKMEHLETEASLPRTCADVSEPCHHRSCSRTLNVSVKQLEDFFSFPFLMWAKQHSFSPPSSPLNYLGNG